MRRSMQENCKNEKMEEAVHLDAVDQRILDALRQDARLSYEQLAERVGTREIEISRIETGRVAPDSAMKQRIALVLGKPTFEVFEA